MDRKKIGDFLDCIFGWMLYIVLIAGGVTAIVFFICLLIGGGAKSDVEKVCSFIQKQYFPWVIRGSCLTVLIGLISMYINKVTALSIKSDKKEAEDELKQIKEDKAKKAL
jgi:uncharacterized membrane protein